MSDPASPASKRCASARHVGPNPLPVTGFYRDASKPDGLQASCKLCAETAKVAWRAANPDQDNAGRRRRNAELRAAVLAHYGDRCACCGATERLTIDHVNGDGAAHRAAVIGIPDTAGWHFYAWLVAEGFPDDPPLQVLCWPCNSSKQDGPVCRLHHYEQPGWQRCRGQCGQSLPLTAFSPKKGSRRPHSRCRPCRNAEARAARAAAGRLSGLAGGSAVREPFDHPPVWPLQAPAGPAALPGGVRRQGDFAVDGLGAGHDPAAARAPAPGPGAHPRWIWSCWTARMAASAASGPAEAMNDSGSAYGRAGRR